MQLTNWLAKFFRSTISACVPSASGAPGGAGRRKRVVATTGIECLEQRTLLTTELTLSGGALVVTDIAAGGQSDTLTITSDAANSKYVISDPMQTFIATTIPGAVVSVNQHSVDVPFAAVTTSLIVVNTQGGDDTVTANSTDGTFHAGLTISGGTGTDSVTFNNSLAFASGQSLIVNAETFNTGAAANIVTSGAGAITVTADNVELHVTSTLVSPNTVKIAQQTTGRNISLAQETAGQLSLTGAEVDRISAGTLVFGDEFTGSLLVNSPGLSPAGTSTLSLNSGGSTNGTNIVVNQLAITAGVGIIVDCNVNSIAAFTLSGSISIIDANGLTVTSVAGVDGIVKQPDSGSGSISLELLAGNLTVLDTPAADDLSAQGVLITLDGSGAVFSTATGSVVHSTGGAIYTISADEMTLQGTLKGDAALRLQPHTAGVNIVLGSNPGSANSLELSAAEIALLDLPSILFIGRNDASGAGDITITAPVVTTAGSLRLETSGGIVDGNTTGIDISAQSIILKTGTGIGVSGGDQTVETMASELGVENLTSGDALVSNLGNVILNSGSIGGLKNNGGSLSITNTGTITALLPVTVTGNGNLVLNAQGVNSDIIVQNALTSAAGTITLRADDDITTVGTDGHVTTTSGNLFFYVDDDASSAGSLAFGRPINLGSGTATFSVPNPNGIVSGVIDGTGAIVKSGAGTLTISAANTYSGSTSVNAGRLNLDGSASSNTTVASGGTLGGTGVLNGANTLTVESGGAVAPGSSPGQLFVGGTTLNSGSAFNVELNGTTIGTEYDHLFVTGFVDLDSATLNVSAGFTPNNGTSFIIISNDGADAVTGTFNNLPEGAFITAGNDQFQISYVGGSGNDVVLTYKAPEVPLSLLDLGGQSVTWIKKQPPVTVLPQLTVTTGTKLSNGTLTVSIVTVGTRKKALDQLKIPTIAFGTSTSVSRTSTLTSITIQLGADDTASEIQSFLRGIQFSTKGKGLKLLTRTMNVTLADNAGHSTHVAQTIHVRKKP